MRTADSVLFTFCPPAPELDLGHDKDRCRRGLDPSVGLRDRDALDPVGSRLELETGIGALSDNHEGDKGIATKSGRLAIQDLDLPSLLVRIVLIHAEEIARKDIRLVAAGSAADFHDDVLFVVLVLRKEFDLKLCPRFLDFLLKTIGLFLSHLPHLRIGILHHLPGIGKLSFHRGDFIEHRDRRFQGSPFLRKLGKAFEIALARRQNPIDILKTLLHRLETFQHEIHDFFLRCTFLSIPAKRKSR